MAELKPCPFCGSEDIAVWESHSRFSSWSSSHFAQCNSCCATSDAFKTMEEAIEAWNRRAEDGEETD